MMDVEKFKSELQRYWKISDKGELSWFLRFEVKCNRAAHTISINQCTYIDAMLDKFRLTQCKASLDTNGDQRAIVKRSGIINTVTRKVHVQNTIRGGYGL
jgi:hypothetical protein